jgi:putative phosphoesterase
MHEYRIGVISDTHGLLRPEALPLLAGVDRIIHAGDVGRPEILDALNGIAPVVAVRGNIDRETWALRLPMAETIEIGDVRIHVLHDIAMLDVDLASIAAVVSGHSHRPSVERRDGVLYLNPGSAGPRRFSLPISIALMDVRGSSVEARIVELEG